MGMPITTYNVLDALAKSYPEEYEIEAVERALKPFNLFAFIIHDPEVHSDFDARIRNDFTRLDHSTGDSLLFFALVDPPQIWLDQGERNPGGRRNPGRERPYYRELSNQARETRQELLAPGNAITSTDKSITAFSLATSLEISYDDLPCLVITPNFSLKRFMWVRTCSDHVKEQLNELGYRAAWNWEATTLFDPTSFNKIKEDIDLCGGIGTKSLACSLAEALADVLSFVIESKKRMPTQVNRVRNTICKLNTTLKRVKKSKRKKTWKQKNYDQVSYDEDDRGELDDKLEELCLQSSLCLAHLNTQPDLNLDEFVNINREFLEPDSYLILKTAHLVLSTLRRPGEAAALFEVIEENPFDFTPGVICLAKVFEKEINLSIVHWIRASLGIQLPTYFNQFQPNLRKQETSFNGVNFNRVGRRASWYPPETGKSLRALRALSQADERNQLDERWVDLLNSKVLLKGWETIKRERNTAAHNKLVNENSADAVQCVLNNLSQNGIFEMLSSMKTVYRGN